jgi:cysteinyl-tRNA synthetase
MVCKHLGEQIDIHGGGTDLMFPHHENEIAQSEGALKKEFSKVWMHWQMLNFGGQKMSKSLKNFTTMREFLERYHPEIYKWMILSNHYRHIGEFGPEIVEGAVSGLARVYSALAVADSMLPKGHDIHPDAVFAKLCDETWGKISDALNDDLATPEAFAAMFDLVRTFNTQVKRGQKSTPQLQGKALAFRTLILRFGKMMSLFQQSSQDFLTELDNLLLVGKGLKRDEIQAVVEERMQARANKDFKASDELRAKLTAMGISVSDTPDGSFWEVTK